MGVEEDQAAELEEAGAAAEAGERTARPGA